MDNILLFLQCPGTAIVKPDQRSMHRIIGSLANQVAIVSSTSVQAVNNIYLRFCTPVVDRSIAMFRTRYMRPIMLGTLPPSFPSCHQQFLTAAGSFMVVEIYVLRSTAAQNEMVDDLVRTWWESVGMPTLLTDRATARYLLLLLLLGFLLVFLSCLELVAHM